MKKLFIISAILILLFTCSRKNTPLPETKEKKILIEKPPEALQYEKQIEPESRYIENASEETTLVEQSPVISWVKIISENPTFLRNPKVQEEPLPEGFICPVKDQYAPVFERKTIDGVIYYHISQWFSFHDYMEGGFNVWTSEKDAEEIPDFFQYTLEKVKPETNIELLKYINKLIEGHLNVEDTRIKKVEMEGGIPYGEYYKIRCKQGTRNPFIYLFIAKYKDSYKLLHIKEDWHLYDWDWFPSKEEESWEIAHTSYLKIKDIDMDGNSEFIEIDDDEIEETGLTIYSFKKDKYVPILNIYTDGRYTIGAKDFRNLDFNYIILFKHGFSDSDQMTYKRSFSWKYPHPQFNKDYEPMDIRVFELREGKYFEIKWTSVDLDYKTIFDKAEPKTVFLYDNTGN